MGKTTTTSRMNSLCIFSLAMAAVVSAVPVETIVPERTPDAELVDTSVSARYQSGPFHTNAWYCARSELKKQHCTAAQLNSCRRIVDSATWVEPADCVDLGRVDVVRQTADHGFGTPMNYACAMSKRKMWASRCPQQYGNYLRRAGRQVSMQNAKFAHFMRQASEYSRHYAVLACSGWEVRCSNSFSVMARSTE